MAVYIFIVCANCMEGNGYGILCGAVGSECTPVMTSQLLQCFLGFFFVDTESGRGGIKKMCQSDVQSAAGQHGGYSSLHPTV